MGRKQKLKQQRKPTEPIRIVPNKLLVQWWFWLIGVALLLGLAIAILLMVVQANRTRFLKLGIQTAIHAAENELKQKAGRVTWQEEQELRRILQQAADLAAEPGLDAPGGSQLYFALNAAREMIQQGDLQPGELEKLRGLLEQTGLYLKRRPLAASKNKP